MGKEVSAAIGTQRQFAKQPELPYQMQLSTPRFGSGINPNTRINYDAQALARALGVIPRQFGEVMEAIDKGQQENAKTLINADKIFAGKTKEDLKTFDSMMYLQNVEGHNMSNNKYAMAILEQGKGRLAGTYAKQEWFNSPESQKPKNAMEQVQLFNKYMQENYQKFGDNIHNRQAYDQGYFQEAMKATMQVANEAEERIEDDNRQKMYMLGSSEAQDLIFSGATGEALSQGVLSSMNKIQAGTRTRQQFMQVTQPLFEMIAEKSYTTATLNAFADYNYDKDTKVRNMMNLYPYYKKIASNFDKRVTDDIYNKAKRADGTIDYQLAGQLLSQLPQQFAVGNGVPAQMLPVAGGDLDNISDTMRQALPGIGGALYSMGYTNAQFTSGYRDGDQNKAANGADKSYHLTGDAVDIDLGADLSEDAQENVLSYFRQYFKEALYHDVGSGLHLHLAGYNGNMKIADPREESASAFTADRMMNIQKRLKALDVDIQRKNKQRQRTVHEDLSVQALSSLDTVSAIDAIYNSDLPDYLKEDMANAVEKRNKKALAKLTNGEMSLDEQAWYNYEKGLGGTYSLAKDWQLKRKYEQDLQGSTEISKDDMEAYDEAVSRINQYWQYSSGGAYAYADNDSLNTKGEPVNKTLADHQEAIQEAIRWVASNPTDSQGNPLSQQEILTRLNAIAAEVGLSGDVLISQVFGGDEAMRRDME